MDILEFTQSRSPELAAYLEDVAAFPPAFEGDDPLSHSSHNHIHLWKVEYLADRHSWIDTDYRTEFAKYVLEKWRVGMACLRTDIATSIPVDVSIGISNSRRATRPPYKKWPVMIRCLLLIVIVTTSQAFADTAREHPNVILIVTDDQGYGDMSCHGNPWLKTPNIDRLHDESLRLTDFHVDPTCAPTRAALMTGRYASRVGVWLTYGGRHHLRRDETTMADVFKQNGYATAMFGKWHLGDNYPFRPSDRGFDESLTHGGGVIGEAPDAWGNDYYDDVYLRNDEPEQLDGYCTDVWFDETMNFIDGHADRPFFVYLATNAPHGPMNVPIKWAEPYMNDSDIPETRARFYGMIANIDWNLGRLREHLEQLGIERDTIIIYLNDNGTSTGVAFPRKGGELSGYNAGMRGKKASAYEGGHRAACFIHWRNRTWTAGDEINQPTAHIDLLPTLADLCGLALPRDIALDGRSVFAKSQEDRTLFVHHQGRFGQPVHEGLPIKHKDYCVMTPRWRLVGRGPEVIELYDFNADPGQRQNVAGRHPAVVERLSDAYEAWWADISPRFEEYCPTVIDAGKQKTIVLTCQDWHGDAIPYNQQHVRLGMQAEGYWVIDVEKPGEYVIELRRWPRDANLALNAEIPQPTLDPAMHDPSYKFSLEPTRRIEVAEASLRVGDQVRSRNVAPSEKSVRFNVELQPGEQRVQAWFADQTCKSVGAYYVYIEPVE